MKDHVDRKGDIVARTTHMIENHCTTKHNVQPFSTQKLRPRLVRDHHFSVLTRNTTKIAYLSNVF
jgi:hypothetical protein